jgi:hypothetical protein
MVCMFVAGGLSMWDDLDGVTERRATLPGPVAVLDSVWRVIWGYEMRTTSNTVRGCVEWQQLAAKQSALLAVIFNLRRCCGSIIKLRQTNSYR